MLTKDEFYSKWSQLHSDAPITGAVAWWLKISYRFGLIATLLRISPNVLTLLGLISAAMSALTATTWWAVFFLVFSLFCDGIDGSVAIFQKRDSAWGATLDSVVDRISEAFWLYALYVIGVPAWLAIAIWSVAAFQEYARAKLSSLKIKDIGVVTPAERPVRASILFTALIMWQLNIPGIVLLSWLFLVLQVISFAMVIRYARAQLR
ncbi:MAG: CDP-diacylglycerol--glycerol-3-phosphate 3-phosphatidyltransferase [Actinobacteria bacterium]|jgi:CDP-diacylglycerol--glycerol-3-phosphate 3-phosphatidyltransferase|nr:CDP-diacylglycerol--glycerol-3-phosphate 3-phosphatidyltransferase [Actinomycetota bacterium]